jgi:hypothetical protein
MTRMIFKPVDIILAAAPAASVFSLSYINDIAATAAAVLGVVYLGIGIALRWRKWRRGE